jgi:hypothetical protein
MRTFVLAILTAGLLATPATAQVIGSTTVRGPFAGASVGAGLSANTGPGPVGAIGVVGADGVVATPVTIVGNVPVTATIAPDVEQDDALDLLFGKLRVDVGFEFLQPVRSGATTEIILPASVAGVFPLAGQSSDLTHNFAFIPKFGIEYNFSDLGFGAGASGKLFTLNGRASRSVSSPAGTSLLSAQDSVDVAIANMLEGVYRFDFSWLDWDPDCWFHRPQVMTTFGARYSYVRQNLDASLVSANNLIHQTATQDFTGFGVTGSVGGICMVGNQGLGIYGFARGSVLVGTNNRSSTFSVVVPSLPDGSTADQIADSRTVLIPVGEFEAGVTWISPLLHQRATATPYAPLGWIRAGMAAQIWGDLGLLETPAVQLAASQHPLVLWGFTISAGLAY